ncbi:MAG TPA: hypothetical protein VK671_08760 [Mucilaginibacter sp.]|nr:hypothetical protein [Mucilaginibacter sp.]
MTNNHLTTFLTSLKTDLIHSMQAKGKYATGQTAQQITIEGDGDNYQLNLPAYIEALETGRSPTGKNALPGSPPMIDRIKQWCQAKGIPDKAAWSIKKSIDKKGYKGIPGIISEPLGDANINLRLNQAADPMADAIAAHLVDSVGLS